MSVHDIKVKVRVVKYLYCDIIYQSVVNSISNARQNTRYSSYK